MALGLQVDVNTESLTVPCLCETRINRNELIFRFETLIKEIEDKVDELTNSCLFLTDN